MTKCYQEQAQHGRLRHLMLKKSQSIKDYHIIVVSQYDLEVRSQNSIAILDLHVTFFMFTELELNPHKGLSI